MPIHWTEDSNPQVRFQLGSIPPNEQNLDNSYLYLGGGRYPHIDGTYGSLLELAGNDVYPVNSRGRAQLFSGNVPTGRIGMDIMHPEGYMLWQDRSTTTLEYQPSTGLFTTYRDHFWKGNFGIKAGNTEVSVTEQGLKIGSSYIFEEEGVLKVRRPNGDIIEL